MRRLATLLLMLLPILGHAASPTFVSSATAANSNVASRSVSDPASTQEGDLYVVLGSHRNGDSGFSEVTDDWQTPSGWTKLADFSTTLDFNNARVAIWYRFRGSSDVGSTSFVSNGAATGHMRVTITAWRGVDLTTPFDVGFVKASHVTESQNGPAGTNPAITTVTPDALVVLLQHMSQNPPTTPGAPSGYTLNASHGGWPRNHYFASKAVSSAGTETPGAWTHSGMDSSADTANITLALRPVAATAASGWIRRRR